MKYKFNAQSDFYRETKKLTLHSVACERMTEASIVSTATTTKHAFVQTN